MTPTASWRDADVLRVDAEVRTRRTDRVALEAPLDIRLQGQPFVLTMRTPGDDAALAVGFLLAEGVIASREDIGRVDAGTENGDAVAHVTLAGNALARLPALLASRRQVTATSACGVCGRPSAAVLAFAAPTIDATWTMPAAGVAALPDRLREHQRTFDQTGGLHAAGVFTRDGALVDVAEDVGRHNAVDKVLGRLLMQGAFPLSTHVLCVSGRASFELVQKAVMAGMPMLVAVSAPSSLAVDLARERNVTLAGFVRGTGFNVYTHAARIA